MAGSTIVIPNFNTIGILPTAIAQALITGLTQAQTDINGIEGGALPGIAPVHVVDLATTAALPTGTYNGTAQTFTVTATGTLTIDSVVSALGDRIAVKNEGNSNVGIYVVTTAGAGGVQAVLTRAFDWSISGDVQAGMLVTVKKGTVNTGLGFLVNYSGAFTLDTTIPTFQAAFNAPKTAGSALTDTSPTITTPQGMWRTLPAATLTANRTITLGTTGAVAGDTLTVTRIDQTAFTLAIVNGGAGAGTLGTMPGGWVGHFTAQYDGTNWALRTAGNLGAAATQSLPGTQSAADKKFEDGLHSAVAVLTDASVTIDISQGTWRRMPAATLTANRTLTISPSTGTPLAGDQIYITRLGIEAFSLTIVDGGPGTPTLATLPPGFTGSATVQFDGTNWFLKLMGTIPVLQAGTATLTSGTVTIATANITATSRIVVSMKTPAGTTTLTTGYIARGANRSNGAPGSFTLEAIVAAGTINTADASVLDWHIVN